MNATVDPSDEERVRDFRDAVNILTQLQRQRDDATLLGLSSGRAATSEESAAICAAADRAQQQAEKVCALAKVLSGNCIFDRIIKMLAHDRGQTVASGY